MSRKKHNLRASRAPSPRACGIPGESMSKNFELLQRAEIGIGDSLMNVAIGGSGKTEEQAKVAPATVVEPAVREESLKLVQRLFLTPGQAPLKAVMFAAIDSGNAC